MLAMPYAPVGMQENSVFFLLRFATEGLLVAFLNAKQDIISEPVKENLKLSTVYENAEVTAYVTMMESIWQFGGELSRTESFRSADGGLRGAMFEVPAAVFASVQQDYDRIRTTLERVQQTYAAAFMVEIDARLAFAVGTRA